LIEIFKNEKIDYLRLVNIKTSLIMGFIYKLVQFNKPIYRLSKFSPYYSSLQISIWERNHLLKSLKLAKNIWQFEELYIPFSKHYVSTKNIISYRHMVEKSKWLYYAFNDIRRLKNEYHGQREISKKFTHNYILINSFKFKIFGYTFFNFKRLTIFLKFSISSLFR